MKQLERWKERKALEREKEKREMERKGVFKTGLYQPKDVQAAASRPVVPPPSARLKEVRRDCALRVYLYSTFLTWFLFQLLM